MAGDISTWLADLGLGKHVQVFVDNEIDLEAVRHVTVDDLKEMGLPIGPRKKILHAILQLADQPKAREVRTTLTDVPGNSVASSADAERRHLTVMFCDLVGSTEHANSLDPEDMHALLTSFQKTCGRIASDHGGHVAKLLGDGLLVYFGYPKAGEDDAERAVRASLAILDAVRDIDTIDQRPLRSRIGIASGVVVIGDILSGSGSDSAAISGSVPHLAARLESSAAPNSVLIAQSTRQLIGGLFDLEPREALELKGFDEPITAFVVRSSAEIDSRFAATRNAGGNTFVGRDNELGMLRDSWDAAVESEGQAILISGEAGIGKSRLLAEFCNGLAVGSHTRLRYQCTPQHTNAPLYPIVTQLRRAAGISGSDRVPGQADKLENLLRQAGSDIDATAPVFAELLGIKAIDRYGENTFAPELFKTLIFDALARQLEGLASRQTLVVLFEDLHWADPLTKDLLSLLIARCRRLPVLILVTTRPEEQPSWLELPQAAYLNLNRLRRRGAIDIVQSAAGKTLPRHIVDEILERADGNPLFIEEITRSLVEPGLSVSSKASRSGPAIPATLHDSLVARLDRLATEKDVAQIASVIGRTFELKLLALASGRSDEIVRDALRKLEAAGILYERPSEAAEVFEFKHALIRDAAYDSLSRTSRTNYHRAVAQCLEEHYPEVIDQDPGLIAQHFVLAALEEAALPFLLRAGNAAHSNFALEDAARHLRRGLEIISAKEPSQERDSLELTFQAALGLTLNALLGYSAEATGTAYGRAYELLPATQDANVKDNVLSGYYTFIHQRAEFRFGRQLAAEKLKNAEDAGDSNFLCSAYRTLASLSSLAGNFSLAEQYARKSVLNHEATANENSHRYVPHNIGVGALVHLSTPLWHMGQVKKSNSALHDALSLARESEHPNTLCYALWGLGLYGNLLRQDKNKVKEAANEMGDLAETHDMAGFSCLPPCWTAFDYISRNKHEDAWAHMEAGRGQMKQIGQRWGIVANHIIASEIQAGLGKSEEALQELDSAKAIGRKTGERWLEAEVLRLIGSLKLETQQSGRSEACQYMGEAIELAREQGSRMFELRSAVSLAHTTEDQAQRAKEIDRIKGLLSEIDADETEWDIQRAKVCIEAMIDKS